MLDDTMSIQSANSQLCEDKENQRPGFFNKQTARKKEKEPLEM